MLTFVMISRHATADRPADNTENRKVLLELSAKQRSSERNTEPKQSAMECAFKAPHRSVVEVPSMAAFKAISVEPSNIKLLNFETAEWKLAQTGEELMQAMMRAQ